MATNSSVTDFLASIDHPVRRRDAQTLADLMQRVTGEEPHVERNMVGFGEYHYKYASGREGDAAAASFAPRKAATTIYLMDGVDAYTAELKRLGPHTTGVGCLYIKDLEQIDLDVLEGIIATSYATLTSETFGQRARESGEG